jgi:VanZ family protein
MQGAPPSIPPETGSATARALFSAWLMAVLYLSLVPLEGWADRGLDLLGFLGGPLPHHWTWIDTISNVIAYVGLGGLAMLAVFPHLRGWTAVVVVVIGCSAVSMAVEALQTFNPDRYPQLLDWLLNSLGALIGALTAHRFSRSLLIDGWLRLTRDAWFAPKAGMGIVLALIWPLLSYFPQHQLFATGRLIEGPPNWQYNALISNLANSNFGPIWLGETLMVWLGGLGFAALLLEVLRPIAPRIPIVMCGIALACAARAFAVSISTREMSPIGWLTVSAQIGIVLAVVTSYWVARLNDPLRRAISLLILGSVVFLANALPYNAYFALANLPWSTPTWNNLRSTLDLAAVVWPFATVIFFIAHASARYEPRH